MKNLSSMIDYFRFMKKSAGLPEQLTYAWMLENGVVAHKDGALSIHFNYFAPDMESQEEYSINMLVTKIFRALSYLNNGWMFEENLICSKNNSYHEVSKSRDIVSDLIDKERKDYFVDSHNIFQNQYVISFTYKDPKRSLEDLKSKVYVTEDIEKANKKVITKDNDFLTKFIDDVFVIIDLLQADGIRTQQLSNKELYQFLKNIVNCLNDEPQPFDYKCFASKMFLDQSLSQSGVRTGSALKINDNHVRCLSLDDIPNEYYPTILNSLNVERVNFRFSARFNYISQSAIHKIFRSKHTEWSFKLFGSMKNFIMSLFQNASAPIKEDAHAREMLTDVEMARTREKYGSKYGYMTLTLIVWDEEEEVLEEKINTLKNVLRQESFSPRKETINATNSFLGSLVGHGGYNCRANPVELELFCNFMATMGIYQGSQYSTCSHFPKESAPLIECMTAHGYRKFYYNMHDKDKGHEKIVGPTGSGKTMLLGLKAASWLKKYDHTRIIGADYQNSMFGICTALDGRYIDISHGDVQLAPFINCDDEAYTKEFLIPWLKDIYKRSNKSQEGGKVENKSIYDAVIAVTHFEQKDRTLERFIAQIDDEHTQAVFQQFRRELPHNILSGNSDDIFDADFCIFNKEPILNMHDSQKFPLLDFIYYKQIKSTEKASYKLGKPTPFLMILDEASFEFNDDYMRAKMYEYIKMTRQRGGAIIFTFQSAEDVVGSGTASKATLIDDNINTTIYLPNLKAHADKKVHQQYVDMGLSEVETQIIAEALPNKEYYISQKNGSKLVNIELGKIALAFFDLTIKNKKDLEHMKDLKKSYPNDWANRWLEYRNAI